MYSVLSNANKTYKIENFVRSVYEENEAHLACRYLTNLCSAAAAMLVSASASDLVRSFKAVTADCVSASTSSIDEEDVTATSEAAAWSSERSSSASSTSARIA